MGGKQATYTVALAGSSLDVDVSGTGDPRPARLEESGPMALGSALVGERSAPVTVEITNVGDLDADITSVDLAGPDAAEVEPVDDRAYSIAAGKDGSVTLKLAKGDRRRLARKRSLMSAVTVVTTQPDGSTLTTHQGKLKLLRARP